MSFVANFLGNTTVKEFRKSANICQSYERMYSGTVFDSLCRPVSVVGSWPLRTDDIFVVHVVTLTFDLLTFNFVKYIECRVFKLCTKFERSGTIRGGAELFMI